MLEDESMGVLAAMNKERETHSATKGELAVADETNGQIPPFLTRMLSTGRSHRPPSNLSTPRSRREGSQKLRRDSPVSLKNCCEPGSFSNPN